MGRLAGIVVVALGIGACEVAEAPPLRADARDTTDGAETRVEDAAEPEDTRVEVEPEDTRVEVEPEDTRVEVEPEVEDTRVEPEVEDTRVEPEVEDARVEPEVEDTLVEHEVEDTSVEVEDTSPELEVADASDVAPACQTTTTTTAPVPSPHIATCSAVSYATNPPTSGPHYPIWAQYKTYVEPVPRGFWVHNLEHGAVVVAYRCPEGCAADVLAIEAMVAARPADPLCSLGVSRRVIVTPDPLLDARFAVAAWGASLVADCFDADVFGTFVDAHYALGPENFCADGVDVTVPDLGTYCPP